jgi:threonine dehydratase
LPTSARGEQLESHRLPGLADIIDAEKRIAGVASRTPLVLSPALSERFHREVYLKLECFQPIRVFKIRGAYNKVSRIEGKKVIAVSSGNHGTAVAYSAKRFGKECKIILPKNAVQEKVNMIMEYGAEIIKYGNYHSEREAKAQEIVKETGATFVHPFNDPAVIAGQGTCGLEIAEQLEDLDSVIVPVGGGGLISGIAIALKSKVPNAKIFGVEPKGATKLLPAMKAGRLVSIDSPNSIADGLIPPSVGDLTLEACMKHVDGVYSVSDEEILDGMKVLTRDAHIFPEPSGSAPAALLLANRDTAKLGKKVVLVVSGGNVSLNLLSKILNA